MKVGDIQILPVMDGSARFQPTDASSGPLTPTVLPTGACSTTTALLEPALGRFLVRTADRFDHIGWASRDGAPVFPNATYRRDGRDWE